MTDVQIKRGQYVIDGVEYPRVSSYLRGIPKPWLGGWAAKQVAEFAINKRDAWADLDRTDALKLLKGAPWTKRDDAADRGSAVHAAIEACANDTELPDMTEEELDCAIAAEQFIDEFVSQILGVEVTVMQESHINGIRMTRDGENPLPAYAGTFDMLCRDQNGVLYLLDWKTSADIYPEHAIQQAAYYNARPVDTDLPWPPDRLGIVHVTPEAATLYPIDMDQVSDLFDVFCSAATVADWQRKTDSYRKDPEIKLFGEPMRVDSETEAV